MSRFPIAPTLLRRRALARRTVSVVGLAIAFVNGAAVAASASYAQSSSTQLGPARATATVQQAAQVDPSERAQSEFWGLSIEEVRRAALLMKGPRGAFSQANLTPVEALGIHARSDAERQKYAELFSRILHADTERVIAWSVANAQAMARLYPNEPVIDFSNSPHPVVDSSTARAAMVPQWAITKPSHAAAPAAVAPSTKKN